METWMEAVEVRAQAALTFLLLLAAGYLYLLGFASSAWNREPGTTANRWEQYGLWESCSCVTSSDLVTTQEWFTSAQAFITLGLIGLVSCICLAALYMCTGRVSRALSLTALTAACITTTVVMLIGVVVFGAEAPSPHWGFAFAVLGMCCTCGACVLSLLMLRQDEVCCFARK